MTFGHIFSFLPAMAVITSFELLWPIVGTGPLYSRAGNFIKDKCTQNWWYNMLLINNLIKDPLSVVSERLCT